MKPPSEKFAVRYTLAHQQEGLQGGAGVSQQPATGRTFALKWTKAICFRGVRYFSMHSLSNRFAARYDVGWRCSPKC